VLLVRDPITLQSTGAIAPEFMARWNQSPSGRAA